MIVQAEHIPVHLGAMPDAVAAVMRSDPAPDDVFILNDPYTGGTHLPDITLVSRTALGFAASRAHHADVGGVEPGSMPATSRTLAEEGVVIPPTRLDDATLEALVRTDAQPGGTPRRPARAARSAHPRRAARRRLCARHGRERVAAAMNELYDYSERLVRAGIAAMPDGRTRRATSSTTATEIAVAPAHRGRLDRARLRRNRPAAGRQPQLPARGDALRLLLRRALPRRARRPRLRRRVRAGDRSRAGRLDSSTRAHRQPSPAATSRPRAASSTPSSQRSDRRCPCPRKARAR